MGLSDFAKVMNEPVCKLIDALRNGAGILYEPTHLKRMADAEAYRIEKIGDVVRNNSDLPIVYQGRTNELGIDIKDAQSLVERTRTRMIFQELRKQQNLDSIVSKTYALLENQSICSEKPINNDFMVRFVEAAQNISDIELQTLWAKILAGEIIMPDSCSLRTIEVLKNMSKTEFDMFLKICPFISDGYLINNSAVLGQFDINYEMLLILDECNLINTSGAFKSISESENDSLTKKTKVFNTKHYILFGKSKDKNKFVIQVPVYKLTKSGSILSSFAECEDEIDFVLAISKTLEKQYKNINFNLYKIIKEEKSVISYEDDIDYLHKLNKNKEI